MKNTGTNMPQFIELTSRNNRKIQIRKSSVISIQDCQGSHDANCIVTIDGAREYYILENYIEVLERLQ